MSSQQAARGLLSLIFGVKALIIGLIGALVGVVALGVVGFILTLSDATSYQGQGQGSGGVANIPPEYAGAIAKAGTMCAEVSGALIAAQIEAESGWNPRALSPVGAQGIAQFMPGTWAGVGVDGDGDGVADPFNPQDAIISQGKYLCAQVRHMSALRDEGKANGSVIDLALAAYNAGIGNVIVYRGVPPFGETQGYIARIKERLAYYSAPGALGSSGVVVASGDVRGAIDWAVGVANHPGSRYVLGGEGELDYDCSGLTQAFMRRLGVELPHKAHLQAQMGTLISEAQAKPGDLIFWSNDGGIEYYHTAIYLGAGMMVSADSPAQGINVEPIWGRNEHIIFKRFIT